MLGICWFSPSSSPQLLGNIGEFKAKTHFRDHHTHNAICSFRDSILVHKKHDYYSRIHKYFEQHFIPNQTMQVITTSR